MHIYHAGNQLGRLHLEALLHEGCEFSDMSDTGIKAAMDGKPSQGGLVESRLLTYADFLLMPDTCYQTLEFWQRPGSLRRLFMDSGAYSVHMRGAEIAMSDYVRFLHDHVVKSCEVYVQLDVVGNPAATRENLGVMEREGLAPLPVYTAAAPVADLERLCERYDYIALGGLRGREAGVTEWRREHLDKVFSVAAKHWPVKFHAFGITAQWVLEDYPMYTADSSVAIVGGSMGRVVRFSGGRLQNYTWQEYARAFMDGVVADTVGSPGTAHMGRRLRSAQAMVQLERHVTALWAARGIVWPPDRAAQAALGAATWPGGGH